MKRIFTILLTTGLIGLMACDQGKVYEKHSPDFGNYEWEKKESVEFKTNIDDISLSYDIYVAVRHIYGFPYKEIELILSTVSPSGEIASVPILVNVIDENNKYLSECAGDYCDLEILAIDDFRFKEKGTQTFRISHTNPIDPLPGVMDVGLVIRKNITQ
ncbi:MAG: gliding motility lipoprotein GldH [Bacteroidales bacterium]|nr:gliding motility lipoprotein GldH [Bacteroidales bacterium]MCF8456006.1 gliding motility lipoprotein GldH [Bacteroidales bacterium]